MAQSVAIVTVYNIHINNTVHMESIDQFHGTKSYLTNIFIK